MRISAKQYAERHGLSVSRVKYLAKERRLAGAIKRHKTGHWEIPEDASILPPREGRGRRHHKHPDSYDGLSVAEVAQREGVTGPRIRQYIREDRLEGAVKGPRGWDISPDYKILPPKPRIQEEISEEDLKMAGVIQ